jgi:hypothetical protein
MMGDVRDVLLRGHKGYRFVRRFPGFSLSSFW